MKIYGAGIAGLLAAQAFQNAEIIEASKKEDYKGHKALLRFRSKEVGDFVGIDFKPVKVHKGIYAEGKYQHPSIKLSNQYSKKVIGKLADRSIWNLDTTTRYVAPEDFIDTLLERCKNRIQWGTWAEIRKGDAPSISTIPMGATAKLVGYSQPVQPLFLQKPIKVKRWRIKGADVYQTVYFPTPDTTLYRASITGDLLIAEYMDHVTIDESIYDAFGIHHSDIEPLEEVEQQFGKIAPIDENWRKQFIYDLSVKHNVFSLGRFGTWRNLLLDDLIHDIDVIKKLVNSSNYEKAKFNCK